MIRLHYLYLRNDKFEQLDIDVFSELISLIVLNLSMNKLQYLYPNTFVTLPNLKQLNLSLNDQLQLPIDGNLINSHLLTYLVLPFCNVSSLSVEIFVNVSAL